MTTDLPPLPPAVTALLTAVEAPPRLIAHLSLVHEVAVTILEWCAAEYPEVAIDGAAVRFGAATHDIGKAVHREELSAPGSRHEPAGYGLLLAHGVAERSARFARSHASWGEPGVSVEELLVSLADKAWKNSRVQGLEDLVVARFAESGGREPWDVFLTLDDLLTRIGDDAPRRLAVQAAHSVTSVAG
ncbi:HD domain-containing protein [Kitasatospora sp. NPDC004240]